MNDKLCILTFQYIFLTNRISQKYLKGFSLGVHAPQSSEMYLCNQDRRNSLMLELFYSSP